MSARWPRRSPALPPSTGTSCQTATMTSLLRTISRPNNLRQQHVTLIPDRPNQLGVGSIIQLAAQAADLRINGAIVGIGIGAGSHIEQLVPAQNALRVLEETPQQRKLAVRQVNERPGRIPQLAAQRIQS